MFTNKVRNPGAASWILLAAMLAIAISSWGLQHTGHDHETWTEILTPRHVFSFLGAVGSVVAAWVSKSPLKE